MHSFQHVLRRCPNLAIQEAEDNAAEEEEEEEQQPPVCKKVARKYY